MRSKQQKFHTIFIVQLFRRKLIKKTTYTRKKPDLLIEDERCIAVNNFLETTHPTDQTNKNKKLGKKKQQNSTILSRRFTGIPASDVRNPNFTLFLLLLLSPFWQPLLAHLFNDNLPEKCQRNKIYKFTESLILIINYQAKY